MPFDSKQEIEIRVMAPDGPKLAVVRFPSDQQWADRMRAQRTMIQDLGRGQSETQIARTDEADLALFNTIRVGNPVLPSPGEEPACEYQIFDSAEASAVIRRLSRADVGEPVRDGNSFRLPLSVPGAETVHILTVPSERQLLDYRRSVVRVIEGRHGMSELRINFAPAGQLYDELKQAVTGYASADIPIIHKAAVISELIQEMRLLEEEPDPANFQSGQSDPASDS